MRNPITPALAPLLLLLSSQAQSACFESALAAQLQGLCSTTKAFCNDLLSGSPRSTITVTSTTIVFPAAAKTSTIVQGVATTAQRTITTATIGLTSNVVVTVARSTSTATGCVPIATCGHFTRFPGAELREACTCIMGQPTTTLVRTLSGGSTSFTTVFLSTVNVVRRTAATRTTIRAKTKHISSVVSHFCSTAAPPAQTCSNKGHQWAQYILTKRDRRLRPQLWNLNTYKSVAPLVNGTATLIGDIFELDNYLAYPKGTSYPPYPNDENFHFCLNDYINDRGYIYAPQSGQYVFDIPAYTQAAYIWVGDIAVTDYNVTNALVKAAESGQVFGGGPFNTIFLQAGMYYPFRVAWRCVSQSFDFYIKITQPDGHIMLGEYIRSGGSYPDYSNYRNAGTVKIFSPYVVQFGCGADAALAPEFPDWGSETP